MAVGYAPEGWEQIPLVSQEPWIGDAHADFPAIEALNIDTSRYRYVGSDTIRPIEPDTEPDIQKIASDSFIRCSAWIMRNTVTQTDMFTHFWPGETDYRIENYLRTQPASEQQDQVSSRTTRPWPDAPAFPDTPAD